MGPGDVTAASTSVLRVPEYRYWLLSTTSTNLASWSFRLAQDWLVLTMFTDHSATAVAFITTLQMAPSLFLARWTGRIADRYRRDVVLRCSLIAQALLSAAMLVCAFLLGGGLVAVAIIALCHGLVSAVDGPARHAYVGDIVTDPQLRSAVALNSLSFNVGRLAGPAAAGLLLAQGGVAAVFCFTGALCLLASATIRSAPTHVRAEDLQRPRLAREEGWSIVRASPELVAVISLVAVVACFGLNFTLTSALMISTQFGGSSETYGTVMAVMAVGSVVGSLVAARWIPTSLSATVVLAALFGVVSVLSGLAPDLVTYACVTVLVGFLNMCFTNTASALTQLSAPRLVRGRVMAVYNAAFIGTAPIGSFTMAFIADSAGVRWSLVSGGAASLLAGVVVGACVLARRSRARREADVPAAAVNQEEGR